MQRVIGVLWVLLLLSAIPSQAQFLDWLSRPAKVKLKIQADDELLKRQVQSYIVHELRALKYVEMSDGDDHEWLLSIAGRNVKNVGKEKLGIVLSFVVMQSFMTSHDLRTLLDMVDKEKEVSHSFAPKILEYVITANDTSSVPFYRPLYHDVYPADPSCAITGG